MPNKKPTPQRPRSGKVVKPAGKGAGGKSKAPVPAPLAPRYAAVGVPRRPGEARYWLLKTEPEVFSFDDLLRAPGQATHWDGVRNFQARNFMRDHMRVGDGVLIYHSNMDPPQVAGIAEVVRAAYPDHTAFDRTDDHYDPKSDSEYPTWMMVDVRGVARLSPPVTLTVMRETKGLEGMELLQRGSRLSVMPVSRREWDIINRLGNRTPGGPV